MLTFDSFTLIPSYSDISSRTEVDISSTFPNVAISVLPIINANMLSVCTPEMINILSSQHRTFSSYHRFFETDKIKKDLILKLLDQNNNNYFKQRFWMSIGTKLSEYDFLKWLYSNNIKNVIVDVNHGHHKMVYDIIKHIKHSYKDMNIMAGNVSSTDGIKFLKDAGADIIKIGNSFGFSCTTIIASGFGCSPIHVAKAYREETNDWDTFLCLDGGIRNVADIAKSLIYGNLVMLGKMFAGCDESYGTKIKDFHTNAIYKEYFGNASVKTKQVINEENHIKNIEGTTKLIPCTGPLVNTLKEIREGLQSAFSFVGARNLNQFQQKAINQILMI